MNTGNPHRLRLSSFFSLLHDLADRGDMLSSVACTVAEIEEESGPACAVAPFIPAKVVGVMSGPVGWAMAGAAAATLTTIPVTWYLTGRLQQNSLIASLNQYYEAGQALKGFEEVTEAVQALAGKATGEGELECRRAEEEVQRLRAQMIEAEEAAKRAEKFAEVAFEAAREDTARLWREAMERSQKMQTDAEMAMAAATEEAQRVKKTADEQRAAAEEVARAAIEEARLANEAKAEAERRLKERIQPVVIPTPEEFAAAKNRVQYEKGRCHISIAGISGSGKSSLVNAFRGLRGRDQGAAAVGVIERTLQLTRYPDTNPDIPFVWYDIPGAGTFKCPDWQYFNDQGLYVFDSIIVLFDNRFTKTDIAILTNARRFNIPTYIVRSKADQHIRNIMMETGYDSLEDDGGDIERGDKLYKAARKQFIEETRKTVQDNLKDANLADQRVYIISSGTLLRVVLNRKTKDAPIDEVDLLNDLLGEIYKRRKVDAVG